MSNLSVGVKHGRLTIIRESFKKNGRYFVECKCDCGNKHIVRTDSLTSGSSKSCGCLRRESKYEVKKGEKYGKLTVVSEQFIRKGKMSVRCECECGEETVVIIYKLINGDTVSCGCLKAKRGKELNYKHGLSNTRIYSIHGGMLARCYNPNSAGYEYYGGKGIDVYKEWHDVEAFVAWAKDNGYEEHLTIERLNNDKGYYPDNCTWIPHNEQNINKGIKKNNKSGYPGVDLMKRTGKYRARGFEGGVEVHLGTFDNFYEAVKVKQKDELERYGRVLHPDYQKMGELL